MKTLKQLGKTTVLFDVDDTLLKTHAIFEQMANNVSLSISTMTNKSPSEIRMFLDEATLAARRIHHVNPVPFWEEVTNLFIREFPELESHQSTLFQEFMNVYNAPIDIKPGALKLLKSLTGNGIKVGLVTNADPEWTWRKLDQHGLRNIFNQESVLIIEPHIKKGVEHWEKAIRSLGVTAKETIGVGDNIRADIHPLRELGALAVWLKEKSWGPHHEGAENLENVIVISSLDEFHPALEIYKENREGGQGVH